GFAILTHEGLRVSEVSAAEKEDIVNTPSVIS
ncbi:MAG: hypothetical protein ACD_39C00761G0002, partial [uncultured bacterium]